MISFLHNFEPRPILFSFGFINVYWYGLFISLAIGFAFLLTFFLAKKYKINKDDLFDLSFYLIIFGVIGARIYDIFLEWQYYLKYPADIIKIWNGGLAIHGAILAGIIVLYFFVKNKKIRGLENKSFWDDFISLGFIIVPGLALGQAIGRWGNYFNQELFGKPTELPWGINISVLNRPIDYISYQFFHPTFLYESLGSLLILIFLILIHFYFYKKNKINFGIKLFCFSSYFVLYSMMRFLLEFIRIDFAPVFLGLRFPQIMSLLMILIVLIVNYKFYYKKLI